MHASPLPAGVEADLALSGEEADLDEFLRETDTIALVVVHEARLVRERYFDGATRESLQTSFSVAKSFVSTLVGIAIDEGLIGSVDDSVTEYLPELADARSEVPPDHAATPADNVVRPPLGGGRLSVPG